MAALASRQDRKNRQSALHLPLRPTYYPRYHQGRESFHSIDPPSLITRNKYQESTKRVLLKDMTYHIIPPSHSPNAIAPSLQYLFSPNDPPNPTLLPNSLLHTFQFVFLIRKPSASISSLYRCFIPPLSEKTDEDTLDSRELGYRETRLLFDYLYSPALRSLYPPFSTASENDAPDTAPILIDADDLLSHSDSILRSFCARLALPYSSFMLSWSTIEDHVHAIFLFKKYAGYNEDALKSTGLRRKAADGEDRRREAKTREEEDEEWKKKYESEAAWKIREAVNQCQEDYEYLKEVRIKPEQGGNEEEGDKENEAQYQDIEEKGTNEGKVGFEG